MAVAKGATVFEKHVGVKTERYALNDYSATPEQVGRWLKAAADAFARCGVRGKRAAFSEKEVASLQSLRRGMFAKRRIARGEKIGTGDVFLAMPTGPDQYTANDMSKYAEFTAETAIEERQPLTRENTRYVDHRNRVYEMLQRVKTLLRESHASVPRQVDVEISHHYGIERFYEYGATILNFVNREYCKKLIVMLPGQQHPEQFHKIKEETFHILFGDVDLTLDGQKRFCEAGEIVTIPREAKHAFSSRKGAVIEEISSKHYADDSYYCDPAVGANKRRKTLVTYWLD
jgi:quercetin dioxygenase-like cupin family protein